MSDVIRQQHVVITAHKHQVAQAPAMGPAGLNLDRWRHRGEKGFGKKLLVQDASPTRNKGSLADSKRGAAIGRFGETGFDIDRWLGLKGLRTGREQV